MQQSHFELMNCVTLQAFFGAGCVRAGHVEVETAIIGQELEGGGVVRRRGAANGRILEAGRVGLRQPAAVRA